MRRITIIALSLLSAIAAVSCHNSEKELTPAAKAMAILRDPSSEKVLVAAHRADWRHHPENSIPAIESVIKMGVDIVELDVAMTSDGVLVLSHDNTVDRTTNGSGLVSSYTLDSLRHLRLKGAHGVIIDTLGMPTLEEALTVCKDRILVNVDHGWDYFPQVLEIAQKVGCVDQIIFKAGGTREATAEAMNSCEEAGILFMPIVTISKDGTSEAIDSYLDGGKMPVMFEVIFSNDIPQVDSYTKALREAGSKIWVNSIWASLCGGNDDERAFQSPEEADAAYGRLLSLGFNAFQTDRPEFIIDYLRKKGLHD
ncbi:MAG: glycerophosphodiester phosphodiesterase family protein [Bacteroidales bacterium]|nr:glycerophosphodiester phosphodiesterase family protein [Bacteroidales bacterium]